MRSLKNIALIITLGTVISKLAGLGRQLVIAGAFGIGQEYDAYNYAYVLPGFFLVLVGGINGPLHNAMVTVLSRRDKREGSYLLSAINTSITAVLIIVSAILFFAADPLIKIIGPGLTLETHQLAVSQLKIMSPIAILSGLIGIGFGSLNARNSFLIPSISPLMSSLVIIAATGTYWLNINRFENPIDFGIKGGLILAQATLIGAILQWLIQLPLLIKKDLFKFRLIWDYTHPGIKEVWKIIWPATFSSGMLQINVFTDLFFASNIYSAAAGLGYANFLIQAPLGLVSNAILLPLLPIFSKLTKNEEKHELISRIRQGLMLSLASMVAIGAIFIALSSSIVALMFGRGAFNNDAINLVSRLLIAYGIGMPAYLCRDLLVRVFYSLGDGKTPFDISLKCIFINIILDWVLIGGPTPWGEQLPFNLGAPGLVIATVLVNILSCFYLLVKLQYELKEINFKYWILDGIKIIFCGAISGTIAWTLNSILIILIPLEGVFGLALRIIFSGAISLAGFSFIGGYLKVKEINSLTRLLISKL